MGFVYFLVFILVIGALAAFITSKIEDLERLRLEEEAELDEAA